MEYIQMTLDDWMDMKRKLEQDLSGVTASFIRIGYTLRRIEEERLYERDGYSSVAEFANKEYGLSASTVSRFMAINRRYSVGGYSEKLAPEYTGLGSSKLSEMLALPDADLAMVTPETPREAIRELKDFNRQEQEGSSDLDTFLLEFFSGCVGDWKSAEPTEPSLKEALNPSGNRVYRKGKYFMAFYDTDIKIKRFGAAPTSLSWGQLAAWVQEHTEELIGMIRREEDAESAKQSQEEAPEAPETPAETRKPAENLKGSGILEDSNGEMPESRIARAQKSPEAAENLKATGFSEGMENHPEEDKKEPDAAAGSREPEEKEGNLPEEKARKPAENLKAAGFSGTEEDTPETGIARAQKALKAAENLKGTGFSEGAENRPEEGENNPGAAAETGEPEIIEGYLPEGKTRESAENLKAAGFPDTEEEKTPESGIARAQKALKAAENLKGTGFPEGEKSILAICEELTAAVRIRDWKAAMDIIKVLLHEISENYNRGM